MLYLDLALRGGAAIVLMLLALLLWRAPIGWEGRLSLVAVAVAKSAFLATTSALPLGVPAPVEANLILLASLTPNAITWLIVTIFLDPPGRRWPWLAASSTVSLGLYASHSLPALALPCTALATALYAALLGLALWTARDDLVDCRCRFRPGLAAAIAGLALFLTGAKAFGVFEHGSLVFALLQSGGTLAVTLTFALWILRPDIDRWPGPSDAAPEPVRAPAEPGYDRALIARIDDAMQAGIWREEGLTIGALAARLAVPEHRLRRAINQGLGHRNFSSFVNRARIAAAKDALSDPERIGTTILEVAYDVGFASLGPFNRAFRAETGQSPSEFRRDALDRPLAGSAKTAPIPVNLH